MVLFFDRKKLIIGLIALLVAEPLLRAVVTPFAHSYEPFYFLTPFRLDSLAAGSLLALLTEGDVTISMQRRWAGWCALILALTLGIIHHSIHSFVRHANTVGFNSLGYSLISLMYLCIVAWVLTLRDGVANSVLSWKPLTYIGRISYGAYLLDSPVNAAFNRIAQRSIHLTTAQRLMPIDLIVIFGLAALSFNFIEQPIIRYAKIRSQMVVEGDEYWWHTEDTKEDFGVDPG
jgi:peptidoglycan/LPS O-acetylase OafA/YrhL